jgi:CHAT domain-containing protein
MHELRRLRVNLAAETLAGPGLEGVASHKRRLEQLAQDADGLEVEIAREVPEVSLDQRLKAADRRHIAEALPEESILVEFVRFAVRDFAAATRAKDSTHYAAFIMEAGKPDEVRLVDLGETETTDALVSKFRESISHAPTWLTRIIEQIRLRFQPDDGAVLRSRIFDPLDLSSSKERRLFLATEGTLAWLPFEALPRDGGYLIDDYRISYLSVGRDLVRLGFTSLVTANDAIVVADPNFDLGYSDLPETAATSPTNNTQSRDLRSSSVYFPPLPETRTEGEKVSEMLGVGLLFGDAAVESQVTASRSPRVLHMATHGFFLPIQPDIDRGATSQGAAEWITEGRSRLTGPGMENPLLRSGLALAGANTWLAGGSPPSIAEDGILNAVDVSSLDLGATDLAVLSACETGLGAAHVWEGVFGLRRAFALAGARTLVMSLWKVADRQTMELMLDFYEQLLAGKPRAESLRDSQRKLKKRYPSPFYWGAFICQGDPGPLL